MAKVLILRGGEKVAELHTLGFLSKEIRRNSIWAANKGDDGTLTVSWREVLTFPASFNGDKELLIRVPDGSIHVEDSSMRARVVTIEVKNPDDLSPLIEQMMLLAGGEIRELGFGAGHPGEPNSFVGGVANDWRRLMAFVAAKWRAFKRQIGQFGFKLAR